VRHVHEGVPRQVGDARAARLESVSRAGVEQQAVQVAHAVDAHRHARRVHLPGGLDGGLREARTEGPRVDAAVLVLRRVGEPVDAATEP